MPTSNKPSAPGPEYTTSQMVRRLCLLAFRFRRDCLVSLLLSIALLILAIGGLQLLGVVIDVIRHALDPSQSPPVYPFGWIPPETWAPLKIVVALSLAIMGQAVLRAWLNYHYNMTTARLTQGKIVPELRGQIYATLQTLSFGFFDRHGSSSIFNRVTGDVQNTRLFVDGVILQGMTMLLTLGAYFIIMWTIHPGLTLACLSTALPLWLATHYYSHRLRAAYLKNRELFDSLVLLFSESVRGMQTVKSFAAETHQIGRFSKANQAVFEQQRKIFRDLSIFTPVTQLFSQMSLVILLVYGGWLYLQGKIPLGTGLVVFAGLLQQFTGQVANITTIANSVQQSLTSAARVFEVLDMRSEVENSPRARRSGRLKGRISFENVQFAYGKEDPVLSDVSFEALPGQVVGIFGMTGSGKTTLLHLIPRFYDPRAGKILADGQDLRSLELHSYRRNIGIVYQESFLFSNTVAANIAFGNPDATEKEIERAARLASAHDFVTALPKGYDTVLGESGVDLSGGQRQRLALARALLLQPSILILDDPTASVDARTEHEIISALRGAVTGRTTFIVANRCSLLRRADVIFVLENGRIAQQGTHDHLVRTPGTYRETALLQMMDISEDTKGLSPAETRLDTSRPKVTA
jgi:ABC-type multidrug transport system fused ATPase/permease subunit